MRTLGPTGFSVPRLLSTPGHFPGAVVLFLSLASVDARADPHKVWVAGAYAFSDELGGFHITGASGIGTRDDPFVLLEEFNSATPVTLTIRAVKPIQPFGVPGEFANGMMYIRIEALNNGGQGWIEFQLELQSILGQPSTDEDGLSFDQANKTPDYIGSSGFAEYHREWTPYDRLPFMKGKVDPLESASFTFRITDFTPKWQFWLVQEPRIPTS